MANYETLKSAIQQVVKTNGNNEITGALLQQSLLAMINSLGSGYQFIDIATPTTNPGTPDAKVFYIASQVGLYPNFGGATIENGEVAIFTFDTQWRKKTTGMVSEDSIINVTGLETTKYKAFQSGSTLMVVNYSPNKKIVGDATLMVNVGSSSATGVSTAIKRSGTTIYRSLTKTGNYYYFPLLNNDEIINIYLNGGNVGDIIEINYRYNIGLVRDIEELKGQFGAIDARFDGVQNQFNAVDAQIVSIERQLDGQETQSVTAFQSGDIIFLKQYSPYKVIEADCKLRVIAISSTATGISVTLRRNGSTLYQGLTKITNNEYVINLMANDQINNIYSDGGASGNTYDIIYQTDAIWPILENLNAINTKSNKTWVAVGDSLTAVSTLGVGVKNYVNYVAERLNLNAINKGVGGTGYWRGHKINNAFYQRVQSFTESADIITIFGSFNDLGNEDGVTGSSIIGSYLDNDNTTLAGCMNLTIDAIISKYPNAVIGIIAPTPWSNSHENQNAELYVEVLKKIAGYRSIPFLDLYHASNLRPWDESFRETYYLTPNDGAHPNTLGHQRFSGLMMPFINSLIY